jgi:hypothetical protein
VCGVSIYIIVFAVIGVVAVYDGRTTGGDMEGTAASILYPSERRAA